MRLSGLILTGAALLAAVSCNLVQETAAHHAVHKGEQAILSPRQEGAVWISVDRAVAEDVNRAVERKDNAALAGFERAGKAFPVEKGTRVDVIGEGFNDRQVRVISAVHAGDAGWVPFEWLQPLPPSQQ